MLHLLNKNIDITNIFLVVDDPVDSVCILKRRGKRC